jgi:hypothetical protein
MTASRMAPVLFGAILVLASPTAAGAQWYAAADLGANHTHTADVTISQPSLGTSVTFRDVHFEARPFASPQYYGWRVGRVLGGRHQWLIEGEVIHLKVFAVTDQSYAATGQISGVAVGSTLIRMDGLVQRYSMSHGLNFVVLNVGRRVPLGGGPFTFVARTGFGVTIPHAESQVAGTARQQYEFAGPGALAAAGIEARIAPRVSAFAEYKVTIADPDIDVPSGTGIMRATTQQIALGLSFHLSR